MSGDIEQAAKPWQPRLRTDMGRLLRRREFLAGAASAGVVARGAGPRPNIVVVLMDDLRWDELHCTGHPFALTPNIDRLAAEGVTFRNAFVTSPLCSPSRACFLTGLYAHAHGITDNADHSPASHRLQTFPRALQANGYETAFIGKWHMGVDDTPRPGFDHWVGFPGQGTYFDPVLNVDGRHVKEKGYTTDILTRYAVELLGRARSNPLCLWLPHKAVHPELTQYADGSISDPNAGEFVPAERHKALFADVPAPRRPSAGKAPAGKPALERTIGNLPPLGPATGTDDETIRNRARMLKAVDEGVGQIRAALDRTGQLDNTVFVFTSDEGYFFGEHGLSIERRLAYEESIRIPMLIRYPKLIRAGSRIDAMALGIDLAPTLLELADTKPAAPMNGRSLVPLLERRKTPWRTSFLIEYFSDRTMERMLNMGYQAVRTERWKYIHYRELEGMDELYDLRRDPFEMQNLIADAALRGTLESLRADLQRLKQ
jgi:N-acetylglucosamine-6-sulfatase